MGYDFVASGGIFDASELSFYEDYYGEGERGLLELDLRVPVSQAIAQELENKLRQAGVEGVSVTTASPILKIYFTKGFPWLAVIAATVLGLITLAILVVGWRLYKEVFQGGLPSPIPEVGTVVAIVLIASVAIAILRGRK